MSDGNDLIAAEQVLRLKATNPELRLIAVIPFKGQELRNNVVHQLWKVETDPPALKAELCATDYQVLKCYESSLTGAPSPYNLTALTTARAILRTEINTLQQKLTE